MSIIIKSARKQVFKLVQKVPKKSDSSRCAHQCGIIILLWPLSVWGHTLSVCWVCASSSSWTTKSWPLISCTVLALDQLYQPVRQCTSPIRSIMHHGSPRPCDKSRTIVPSNFCASVCQALYRSGSGSNARALQTQATRSFRQNGRAEACLCCCVDLPLLID